MDHPKSRKELRAVFRTVLDEARDANLAQVDEDVRKTLEATWGPSL
jgi:hypothetical protein